MIARAPGAEISVLNARPHEHLVIVEPHAFEVRLGPEQRMEIVARGMPEGVTRTVPSRGAVSFAVIESEGLTSIYIEGDCDDFDVIEKGEIVISGSFSY